MKHRFTIFVAIVILTSSLVGGFMGGSVAAGSNNAQTSPNEFLSNFTEALDVIQKTYVDNVGSDKLVYSAIKGMLRALDPHSSFFDPKEFSRLREEQHSKYFGLGIRVRPLLRDRGRVVIVEPPAIGSPAERRGLRAGDVITKIEGESNRANALLAYPERQALPAGLVYKLALALAEAGRFDEADQQFAGRFFPREEGGVNVRQVYLEVKVRRAQALAAKGDCQKAMEIVNHLGDAVPGLTFTQDGLKPFIDSTRFQEMISQVRKPCGGRP